MKKINKVVHLWLSIPAGIFITIMCFTGSMLVFQEEILHLLHPGWYIVGEHSEEVLPLDIIVEKVNAQLSGDTVTAVQVSSNPEQTYVATLSSGQRSHAYINPYTGEITGYYNYRKGFFFEVMRLHRWMLLKDMPTGRLITGVSTIFFVFILISGVVIWWPSKSKFDKSFFLIKRGSSKQRKLIDLHRILGVYTTVLLLLLSLTGLMWSFDWYKSGVAGLFRIEYRTGGNGGNHGGAGSGGQQGNRNRQQQGKSKTDENEFHSGHTYVWQQTLTAAKAEITDYQYIRLADNGTITVLTNNAPHSRATDSYSYNSREETVSLVSKYGDKRNGNYMMTWAYALHAGTWGGMFGKVITFLASLIGASLPVTGYWLWYRRKKRG